MYLHVLFSIIESKTRKQPERSLLIRVLWQLSRQMSVRCPLVTLDVWRPCVRIACMCVPVCHVDVCECIARIKKHAAITTREWNILSLDVIVLEGRCSACVGGQGRLRTSSPSLLCSSFARPHVEVVPLLELL